MTSDFDFEIQTLYTCSLLSFDIKLYTSVVVIKEKVA